MGDNRLTRMCAQRLQNDADEFQTDYQYAYDGINRLVTATGSYVETDDGTGTAQTTPLKYKHRYGYADNGNLTRRDYVDPDTDALNERWNYTYVNHQARTVDSTVDGARFQMSYDLAGNMTGQVDLKTSKEKEITLDSYDRIREVRDPTITEAIGQYWYDDRGFRIRKKAKHDKGGDFTDVETVYPSIYFGMELIGESNTLNSVSNIYHNGLRIAAVAQNGAKVWYLQDQVDSVKLVMGSAGQVLSRAEYLPYGETFVQKGDEDFAPKYNSQELDRETNYYFYNARYYDPQIARFTSADTIIDGEGSSQGWNRYMYVHGNPIGAKDPTGHYMSLQTAAGNFFKGLLTTEKEAPAAAPQSNVKSGPVPHPEKSPTAVAGARKIQQQPSFLKSDPNDIRVETVGGSWAFGPGVAVGMTEVSSGTIGAPDYKFRRDLDLSFVAGITAGFSVAQGTIKAKDRFPDENVYNYAPEVSINSNLDFIEFDMLIDNKSGYPNVSKDSRVTPMTGFTLGAPVGLSIGRKGWGRTLASESDKDQPE